MKGHLITHVSITESKSANRGWQKIKHNIKKLRHLVVEEKVYKAAVDEELAGLFNYDPEYRPCNGWKGKRASLTIGSSMVYDSVWDMCDVGQES